MNMCVYHGPPLCPLVLAAGVSKFNKQTLNEYPLDQMYTPVHTMCTLCVNNPCGPRDTLAQPHTTP